MPLPSFRFTPKNQNSFILQAPSTETQQLISVKVQNYNLGLKISQYEHKLTHFEQIQRRCEQLQILLQQFTSYQKIVKKFIHNVQSYLGDSEPKSLLESKNQHKLNFQDDYSRLEKIKDQIFDTMKNKFQFATAQNKMNTILQEERKKTQTLNTKLKQTEEQMKKNDLLLKAKNQQINSQKETIQKLITQNKQLQNSLETLLDHQKLTSAQLKEVKALSEQEQKKIHIREKFSQILEQISIPKGAYLLSYIQKQKKIQYPKGQRRNKYQLIFNQ